MISTKPLLCALACLALAGVSPVYAHAQDSDQKAADAKANQTDSRLSQDATTRASQATKTSQPSNEKLPQPKRIEDAYPLTNEADRQKTAPPAAAYRGPPRAVQSAQRGPLECQRSPVPAPA